MKALIFHARRYSFAGTNGQVNGTNVVYLPEDAIPTDEPQDKGNAPQTLAALDDPMNTLLANQIPGLYEIKTGSMSGPKGKAVNVITEAKFLSSRPLEALLNAAASTQKAAS